MKRRYHRLDVWRGYFIPANAVAGASDTGGGADSPARSEDARSEIRRFQREVLRPAGVKSRTRYGETSNVFCAKRWVVVREADFDRAARATVEWRRSQAYLDYRIVHDASLGEVGY